MLCVRDWESTLYGQFFSVHLVWGLDQSDFQVGDDSITEDWNSLRIHTQDGFFTPIMVAQVETVKNKQDSVRRPTCGHSSMMAQDSSQTSYMGTLAIDDLTLEVT